MRKSMNNYNNKAHHQPLCTRTQQIAALLLVFTAFFFARILDRTFRRPCIPNSSIDLVRTSRSLLPFSDGGDLSWPQRGYGVHLDLKIYVYDEDEVDGLKELMYGKDGTSITAETCSRGQWGTQVISLLSYEFRLFFFWFEKFI